MPVVRLSNMNWTLPASELDRGGSGATERHVDELGAGELGEPNRREVRRLADAVVAAGELAGIGAQMGDEFRDRVRRHRRVQHQHVRPPDHVRDRQQVLGTVLQVAEQGIGDRLRADVAQQDGVAVRPGAHHLHGADGAAAARLVLRHRVLVPALLQVRGEQPRHDVGGAAGGSGNDDADGLARTPATLGTSLVAACAAAPTTPMSRRRAMPVIGLSPEPLSPLNRSSAACASETASHRRARAGRKAPATDEGLGAAPARPRRTTCPAARLPRSIVAVEMDQSSSPACPVCRPPAPLDRGCGAGGSSRAAIGRRRSTREDQA